MRRRSPHLCRAAGGALALLAVLACPPLQPLATPPAAAVAAAEEDRAAARALHAEAVELSERGVAADRDRAIERLEAALPLWQRSDDPDGAAASRLLLARLLRERGEPERALEILDGTVELTLRLDDPTLRVQALTAAAGLRSARGEHRQAFALYREAFALLDGDDPAHALQAAQLLHNLATAHERLGEYQEALERYQEVLPRVRALGSRRGEAAVLNNLATVHYELGDHAEALELYTRILPLRREMGDVAGEARTLSHVAAAHHRLGDDGAALSHYHRALELHRRAGSPRGEADTLNGLGRVRVAREEWDDALEHFTAARELAAGVGSRVVEATAWEGLGRARAGLGEVPAALEALRRALELRTAIAHRRGAADALGAIAELERRRGDLPAAQEAAEEALELIESLRTEVARDELRTSFLATHQDLYGLLVDLRMERHRRDPDAGHAAAALHVVERARARGLLDLLAEAGADVRSGVDPELLRREEELRRRIDRVETHRTRLLSEPHDEADAAALEAELSALLDEAQVLEGTLRSASPRYAALTAPEPLTLDDVRRRVLDADTLLLEYALGEERSFLWVVGHDTFASFELPPRGVVEAAARRWYDLLTAPNRQPGSRTGSGDLAAAAAELSRLVLAPAAELLREHRLAVVGDGALRYVPFAALPHPLAGGGGAEPVPLIVRHEVVSLPSASVLAVLRREAAERPPAPRTLAVFADPVFRPADPRVVGGEGGAVGVDDAAAAREPADGALRTTRQASDLRRLRFSRREAVRLAALVPAEQSLLALDFAADRRRLLAAPLADYRFLHFATHALVDDREPQRTSLVLSLVAEDGTPRNGYLRLHDVYDLELNAELVTLSACDTALGRQVRGEGLVGLTRGFMYAGARRVVASLWQVQDRATAELMHRFYRAMVERDLRPAAALREAQTSMLREERWSAPYFWAPFVLQGEWRK